MHFFRDNKASIWQKKDMHSFILYSSLELFNNDLVKHIKAKTNDRRVPRFGDILASLSRETKIKIESHI